jgi:hypothetical protein
LRICLHNEVALRKLEGSDKLSDVATTRIRIALLLESHLVFSKKFSCDAREHDSRLNVLALTKSCIA